MQDTVFTKIIKGEIPAHKIYEDERTIAFLDIHPIALGHTLVVSKNQVPFVWDLPAEDYAAVRSTAQKLAKHLREKLGTEFIGEQIIGVDVHHAHIHLIPFNTVDEYHGKQDMGTDPNHAALAELAEKLRIS